MAASSVLVGNSLGVSYQIGVDSKGMMFLKDKALKTFQPLQQTKI